MPDMCVCFYEATKNDTIFRCKLLYYNNINTRQNFTTNKSNTDKTIKYGLARRIVPLSKATVNEIFDPELKISARLQANAQYRQAIVSILYLSVCSRPNIAYAINTLASCSSESKLCH